MDTFIKNGLNDWTEFMRKCAKIDKVFKIAYESINFIANSLKKQKMEENTTTVEEIELSSTSF